MDHVYGIRLVKHGALAALMVSSALVTSPLLAAEADAEAGAGSDSATNSDDDTLIVVTGRRLSQASEAIGEDKITATVAITREALLSAPSGISGLKMLETLPGFNVQTDGALGLYEFGNSVQVRAFNLDQIGFVVDGIPTGRSDPFGGSPVFRYVDNENLASVNASPGAGDVSLPSYSSLGPVVSYSSIDPQSTPGLFVSQSFGDFDMKRTFIRASTGQIGPFRGYVSRTKLTSDLWRGAGGVNREHWEAQLRADFGSSSWLKLKFVSNDFHDNDSPTLTRAQYNGVKDINGVTGRFQGYIGSAPPNTTPGFAPTAPGIYYSNSNYTYYYGLAVNVRKDRLYGGTLHLGIADNVYAETTGYWENKSGFGVSPDSYANSNARYLGESAIGLPVFAPKGTQFGKSGVGGDRIGITTTLSWETGPNKLIGGIWAETEKYHRTQLRFNTVDGSPASVPDFSQPVFFRRDYRSHRDTTQVFLKDTLNLLDDKLVLDFGIKGLDLDYVQRGYRDYNDYYRNVGTSAAPNFVPGWGPQSNKAHYTDMFLPEAGFLYKLDDRSQFFGSYAENMAEPKGLDDIYSVALNSSSALVPEPAPERSKNFELGIRTRQPEFYASLAAYYTKFANRIQQISAILPGTLSVTESFYTNVGRVRAYGAEFTGSYKPAFLNGLAYANLNVTYNNAKFKDDIPAAPAPILIAGKVIPDSAKWLVTGGVTVEPAKWLIANISGKYTSRRWSTFTNTPGSAVPGYTVYSAYVDIGDGFKVGPLKTIKARFNIDNLFDKDVLSFILPNTSGDGFFRPLSPRTFQLTISAEL